MLGAADEARYDVVLEEAVNILGFEMPSDLTESWFDSTCLKPNIHFPVDWVLLTDVVRTLMKAVEVIRKHGLKNRMPADDPAAFLKRINQLSINMANSRRQKDGRTMRKAILREIKKLVKIVGKHARKHCDLLESNRMDSDLSEAQAAVVIARIKGVLKKLPQAIVRGKSGAEVEFGNTDTQRTLAREEPARKDHVASKSVGRRMIASFSVARQAAPFAERFFFAHSQGNSCHWHRPYFTSRS